MFTEKINKVSRNNFANYSRRTKINTICAKKMQYNAKIVYYIRDHKFNQDVENILKIQGPLSHELIYIWENMEMLHSQYVIYNKKIISTFIY